MKGWKYRWRELLKTTLFHHIYIYTYIIKQQTDFVWNLLQPPIQVCRAAYIPYLPYFQINVPIFCCPSFSKNIWALRPGSTKWETKILSTTTLFLTSRKHPEVHFLSNWYILPWLWKSFKSMMLWLLRDTLVSQKIESVHSCSFPRAKLSPR